MTEPDDHPPSPCVKVCVLDAHEELCVGCWRSAQEIAAWTRMDANAKHEALARTQLRRAARREQMRELRRQRQATRTQR